MTAVDLAPSAPVRARVMEALHYEAPFLIEKLLKERIVETAADGQALFTEVIRYLILDRLYPDKRWEMYSRRIDEVWHQFILFTHEYTAFCNRYVGSFLHHYPSNAPGVRSGPDAAPIAHPGRDGVSPYVDFCDHYEKVFGQPLPDIWLDRKFITLDRRVLIDGCFGALTIEDRGEALALVSEKGEIFSVSSIARTALEFIVRAGAFYVRELPGELSDEEKIALVQALAFRRVLLIA